MPAVYYSFYNTEGLSIPDATEIEHDLGRKLLSLGISKQYGIAMLPDRLESLLSNDDNGKPCIPDHPEVFFNISHCTGLVACAFHDSPVGIDAELPGYFADVLIDKVLSDTEKEFLESKGDSLYIRREWFYRFWTLKEAYVKKTGEGVDTDLKAVSFSFNEEDTPGKYSITCSDPDVFCFQKQLRTGHIISMCIGNDRSCFTELYHIVL